MSVLLTIYRGDSKTFALTLVEPFSTTPFNPTGWNLLATFKSDVDVLDADAAIQKSSAVGGFTVTNAAAGQVNLSLVPQDTAILDPYVRYGGDIQAQNATTFEIKTVWVGSLKIVSDSSRSTTLSIPTVVVPPSLGYLTAAEMEAAVLAAEASAAAAAASAVEAANASGAVSSVAGRTGAVVLTKADVGLSLADNTSDANKPVSASQAAADSAVAAAAAGALSAHTGNTSNPHGVTKAQVGLSNVSDVAQLPASYLDTDGTMAADSDVKVPSQKAVRTYVAANAGSGSSMRQTVTQNAHGFTAKQAVYQMSDGTWALARANVIGTSRGVHVIESVTTNTFVAVSGGDFTGTGLTAGQYYLSAATAGLLTQTEPSGATEFVVAVMFASTTTKATVEVSEPLSLALIPNSALASDAARPAQVSGGEKTAGTETALRSFSPDDVADMIAAHAPGGSGSNAHVLAGAPASLLRSRLIPVRGANAAADRTLLTTISGRYAGTF